MYVLQSPSLDIDVKTCKRLVCCQVENVNSSLCQRPGPLRPRQSVKNQTQIRFGLIKMTSQLVDKALGNDVCPLAHALSHKKAVLWGRITFVFDTRCSA